MTGQGDFRRLRKSRSNRMIDGVCGGMAEYFAVDPTLVRLAFVLLLFAGGIGFILYIVAMIITPKSTGEEQSVPASPHANSVFWGVLLTAVGVIWLMGNLGFHPFHFWWGVPWRLLLPVALLLAGAWFLFGGRNYVSTATPAPSPEGQGAPETSGQVAAPKRLYRSRREKKLLGVCGGLGWYFDVDPVIIRILFVAAGFASFGVAILVYFVLALVVPTEPIAEPA